MVTQAREPSRQRHQLLRDFWIARAEGTGRTGRPVEGLVQERSGCVRCGIRIDDDPQSPTLGLMTLITTPFGFHSTAAEVVAGIGLGGKRAIVTGAASGIGIET